MMAANLQLVISATDRASATLDKVKGKVSGVASGMRNALMPAAALAGVGLGALSVGALKAVRSASDLNEALNKAVVTFGKASEIVTEFAETSAKKFGISERAANEYAATLGVILQGSGLTQKASAGMSVDLVKLSADLASFNNIPIDVALEKIRAGLVGESEPLRTVGVLLSEAAVATKAAELGFGKVGTKLTDAQKVQARYAIILSQTSKQQGDFARTADGAANKERILAARMEDLKAKIGAGLLPVYVKFLGFLADKVLPFVERKLPVAVAKLRGEWEAIQPSVEQVGAKFLEVGRVIAEKLWPPLQKFLESAEGKRAVIIALALAVGLLAAPLVLIAAKMVLVVAAIAAVSVAISLGIKYWKDIIATVKGIPVLGTIVETVFGFIRNRVIFFMDAIKAVIKIVMALIHGDWGKAWQGVKDLFNATWKLIKSDIKTALDGAWGLIKGLGPLMWAAALGAFSLLKEGFRLGMNGVIKAFVSGLNAIIKKWNDFSLTTPAVKIAGETIIPSIHANTPDLPLIPIPQLAEGGVVARSGLAMVHKGEAFSGVGRGFAPNITINITGTWDLTNPNHIERLTSALTAQIRRNLAMGA